MNKIQEAKAILREAGYFVDNLWHIDDVKLRWEECDDTTAQEILYDALTDEGTMVHISYSIDFYIDKIQEEEATL